MNNYRIKKSTLDNVAVTIQDLRAHGWTWEEILNEVDNPQHDIFKVIQTFVVCCFWPETLLIYDNWVAVAGLIKKTGLKEEYYEIFKKEIAG